MSLRVAKVVAVLFYILVMTQMGASAQKSVSFANPVAYNSGGLVAGAVAVADVNGDAKPDILVVNQNFTGEPTTATDGTVAVLLGNGDGTFQTAVPYDTGAPAALSLTVADVNRDGKPDLVVVHQFSDYITVTCPPFGPPPPCYGVNGFGVVSVLLGKGDGTFQAAQLYDPGAPHPSSVAVADVNGDGKPDLVVTACQNVTDSCSFSSPVNGLVSVLLGNGDGTFQAAVTYDAGGSIPIAVAVADVNGDGKPDLLVASECTVTVPCGGVVGVLLGNGDGTFQSPVAYATGAIGDYADSLAVADVNKDGKLDLIVADGQGSDGQSSQGFAPNVIGVLLGNGDGTFQTAVTYSTGGVGASSVAVADVNGDGKLDIVLADGGTIYTGVGVVSVLLGKGDGTFEPAVNYSSTNLIANSVAVADLNGDLKPDLVLLDACSGNPCNSFFVDGTINVFINNGGGRGKHNQKDHLFAESFSKNPHVESESQCTTFVDSSD